MTTIFAIIDERSGGSFKQVGRKTYKRVIRLTDERGAPFSVTTLYHCGKTDVTVEKRLVLLDREAACPKQL